MAYQEPRNKSGPKHDKEGYQRGFCQQSILDVLNIQSNNLTTLILIIIVTVLLMSRIKSIRKLMSITQRKKTSKKIPKAKLLSSRRLPVLDAIYNLVKFRKDGLQFLERLSEQYGNLLEIQFGPFPLIIVSDPVIIKTILSSTQLAYSNRPKIYHSIFGDIFHNGLLTSENEIWSAQRKLLARSFTYKSLQNFLVFMNHHAANLTSGLNHECEDSNNRIEIQRINKLLCCHAFKIIAQIVMGADRISPDESNEFAEIFNCWKDLVSERLLSPLKYLWLLPKRREYNRCHKYISDIFMRMIQKYKKEYEQAKITSFVHKIHSCTDSDREDENIGVRPFRCMIEEMICSGASNEEVHQQVGTLLGTGHDTTTVAIRMLMLHLALNPDHQVTCREEVDKVMNKKGLKHNTYNCGDEINSLDLKMEDLSDLKYLERCILESGRITSTVPLFLRRIDAPLQIDNNLEFPAGTNFAIANWILHRDPQIYPDPLKFDPNRFLSENVKKRHPYSYTAFSMGPRNCIGAKVAIMQIKVIMAYIIRHFEIFSDDKLEDVKMHFGLTLVPERDYRIVLKRRVQPNL